MTDIPVDRAAGLAALISPYLSLPQQAATPRPPANPAPAPFRLGMSTGDAMMSPNSQPGADMARMRQLAMNLMAADQGAPPGMLPQTYEADLMNDEATLAQLLLRYGLNVRDLTRNSAMP